MKIIFLLTLFFVSICATAEPIHLIPQPVSVTEKPGRFTLDASVSLQVKDHSLAPAADWFAAQLGIRVGKGGKRQIILETPADRKHAGQGRLRADHHSLGYPYQGQ